VEHWDGGQWHWVPLPPVAAEAKHYLDGLAASSRGDVWAVGATAIPLSGTQRLNQNLILHWDSNRWADLSVPSADLGLDPPPSGTTWETVLWAITSLAPDNTWAVGYATAGAARQTLILHWNGHAWQRVLGPTSGSLYSVSARTADDIWASGDTDGQPLIIHWDGRSWVTVPSPAIAPLMAYRSDRPSGTGLAAIRVTAADDAWAVGVQRGTPADNPRLENAGRGVVLHWDGTAWTQVPGPSPISDVESFRDLAVFGRDDVWIVGGAYEDGYQSVVRLIRFRRTTCPALNSLPR